MHKSNQIDYLEYYFNDYYEPDHASLAKNV